MTYEGLGGIEFAEGNAEPRCPVVLLLDTSGSMGGDPIDELNAAVQLLASDLKADRLASLRVEVAIVTFGGTVQALDVRTGSGTIPFDANIAFVTADEFQPPTLSAGGETPMGEAMRRALALLRERKALHKAQALDYFRPWIFLLTDGRPDAGWEPAASLARQEEDQQSVTVFAIGVGAADMSTLSQFSNRQPLMLKDLTQFKELFSWLSKSLSAVAQTKPGDMVPLPPAGWGTIVS